MFQIVSIESALLCLSDREEVSDYRDSLTGMASTLRRHAYLDQLPPFFIFQLKRFTVIAPGDSLGKSLKFIPIEQELRIPKSEFDVMSTLGHTFRPTRRMTSYVPSLIKLCFRLALMFVLLIKLVLIGYEE